MGEALGPRPDPLMHPIIPSSPATSQQSQPSRDQPLRHEPVPSERRDPRHTAGPPFPRRMHHAHCREELTLRRNSGCVIQGVPGHLHACASEPTYRHSPRDSRGFLFFPLVALALPLAQGPLPTFFGPEAGCPFWDGRPVGVACGFSLLRVWTGESRLRRQAGQTGPSGAPRPASVGCILAGVSTALSSSLRPLCTPGTPPTQELCRWHLLQAAQGLWGQPRQEPLALPQGPLPTHPPSDRTGRRRSGSGQWSRHRRSPWHRPSYTIGRCPLEIGRAHV